jgi:hypothetical protein
MFKQQQIGGGNLTLSSKKQRITPPPPLMDNKLPIMDGVESFISQFQKEVPLSGGSSTKDPNTEDLVEGGEEGGQERTGAPMRMVTSEDDFIKRADFIRDQTLITEGDNQDVHYTNNLENLRFALAPGLPAKDNLFQPGVFYIENDKKWGFSAVKNDPASRFREIARPIAARSYHTSPMQTNLVVAGLMESSWRDFYFLCALVIQNYNNGSFKFSSDISLRLPFWDDEKNAKLFLKKAVTEVTAEFLKTPEAKNEPWSMLIQNLDTYWFLEDLPMFYNTSRTPEQEGSYLLSCLDKAAFLSNYGSVFQKRLGFDVPMESLANPFVMEPWEHKDNQTTDLILKDFKTQIDSINDVLKAFREALEQQLKNVEAIGEDQPDVFKADPKEQETDKKRRVKIIEDKVAAFIEKNLTNPIENSIKKLVSSQTTEVALKDSQLRVKKLERQLLKLTKDGGGAYGSTSITSAGVPGEVSKTRKLYLETAIRFEIQRLLRDKYPLFRFGDQLAGTAAIATQRVFRFDFDELVTRDVAENVIPDIGDKALPNLEKYYDKSVAPFKESFGSLNLFAPSTQAAITVCLEKVKLMIFMGGKGGRPGGKRGDILIQDLTEKNQELSVAFATLVALELQVNQEVQRKTSSTHHDQIKLVASVQNADNLMRGLLIKHGWACYPNQYEEANSSAATITRGRLGAF